jgi:flavorubredoxin
VPARRIKENIYGVGAIDWHRKLFDAFIPLPHGTSYNAFLIKGSSKTALIDTVDPERWGELKTNLEQLHLKKLDYIISNHAEQDHSGSIPEVLSMFPEAKVVTNTKCKGLLSDLLALPEEKFIVIDDKKNEAISLGDKTLRFFSAPWVHWPETMLTYLEEDKILFSCDLFGSHLATSDLFAENQGLVFSEAKRYYAQIMMPYAKSIVRYLDVVDSLGINMIVPSHGPIYDKPDFIIDAHRDWVSENSKNSVTIFYISMHGSTQKMVQFLMELLIQHDIHVEPFNLIEADFGEVAMSLVDATTLIFASPAFLVGPHPKMIYAASMVNALKPKARYAAIIGSYGWGNKMVDGLAAILSGLKIEYLTSVLAKGIPTNQTFSELELLAKEITDKHKSIFV